RRGGATLSRLRQPFRRWRQNQRRPWLRLWFLLLAKRACQTDRFEDLAIELDTINAAASGQREQSESSRQIHGSSLRLLKCWRHLRQPPVAYSRPSRPPSR